MRDVLEAHKVLVKSDSADQARLRLLQALWREESGLPIGIHESKDGRVELGSRVADDPDHPAGHNFLTPTIIDQAKRALEADVCGGVPQDGAVIVQRRLWTDLLSSQPMAVNLFGELAADLDLAGVVARAVWGPQIERVTSLCFEWSPGRGDPTYLGNGSAFDVFLAYETPAGGRGFIGVEVKYHENMRARAAKGADWYDHNPRYAEVARRAGAFPPEALTLVANPESRLSKDSLGGTPMQQIWFDHLLALSMLQSSDGWDEGRFVVLAPEANPKPADAADRYRQELVDESTFGSVTLEEFVAAAKSVSDTVWLTNFEQRYLDQGPIDALLTEQ